MHTQPFKGVSETFNWYYIHTFCNLAVPFFFVTSGFLLFRNFDQLTEDARWDKVKKYVLHILKMYGVWCVIWLPWKALNLYNLGHFNLTDLLYYIRDLIFVSGGDALWYLPALAFSVLFIYTLLKKIDIKLIVAIGACLYAVGIALSSWYDLFSQFEVVRLYYSLFSTTSNGLLYGVIFTAIGAYIGGGGKTKDVLCLYDWTYCIFCWCYSRGASD